MAHAERAFELTPELTHEQTSTLRFRRDQGVRLRRASVRLRTSGIQSAGIGHGRERAQHAAGRLWTWPSTGERNRIRMD
jgi:hypothetical protein